MSLAVHVECDRSVRFPGNSGIPTEVDLVFQVLRPIGDFEPIRTSGDFFVMNASGDRAPVPVADRHINLPNQFNGSGPYVPERSRFIPNGKRTGLEGPWVWKCKLTQAVEFNPYGWKVLL